jgi:hypothetical protein
MGSDDPHGNSCEIVSWQIPQQRMTDSTRWMGISTAGERDGRRKIPKAKSNDPRPNAALSGQVSRELTLSVRSSAGQLCPVSARSPRNHTRARPSCRNRRPACAHGRERKKAPKFETKPFVLLQPAFRFLSNRARKGSVEAAMAVRSLSVSRPMAV